MNEYTQDLKSKLERVEEYVVHKDIPSSTNMFPEPLEQSRSVFTFKNVLWTVGIVIVSVSVVAFFTQVVLLALDNGKKLIVQTQTATSTGEQSSGPKMYVRADIESPVFGTATGLTLSEGSTTATSTVATSTATTTVATSTVATSTATTTPADAFTVVSLKAPMRSIDLGIPGVSRIGYNDDVGESVLTDNINKYSNTTLVLGGERSSDAREVGGGDQSSFHNYDMLTNSVMPTLSSKAYLIADLDTGEIIYEKNGETVYPLASVSKLMTAVVAREKMDMQSIAIVSRDASQAYGAQGGLQLGEKIRLRDLLFPLLMESSNDAAEVYADQYGHAKFIEEMNKKATALEMYDTYYGDPSGLDPKNTSNPRDLLKLARYIYMNDPEIYDMTRVKQFSIKGHTWHNANALLSTTGFAGGKNGYIDQARQTTVSLFDVDLAKGGVRTVVIVILKSDAKNNDVAKLLSYLRKSVTYKVE